MASSQAAWSLLSQVLDEISSADDLVRWGQDAWGCWRVVGLRELRVAALLFTSSDEEDASSASTGWKGILDARFDEEVLCVHVKRDGDEAWVEMETTRASSSLLDLALRLGHAELAGCLQQCGLEQQALRPDDFQRLPVASLAQLPFRVAMSIDGGDVVEGEISFGEWKEERGLWSQKCWCRPRGGDWQQVGRWDEEPLHPWQRQPGDASVATGQEHWPSDWKAPTPWARALADTPATRAALALAAEGLVPELEHGAKLRLLDAALLLGDPPAAAVLAGSCGPHRPMRIWDATPAKPSLLCGDLAIEAHIRAGLRDLQGLGFDSAASVAEFAVQVGAPSLAQAASEILPGDAREMLLKCSWLVERDPLADAVVAEGALAALEALGQTPRGCAVMVFFAQSSARGDAFEMRMLDMPLLFLPLLLGDWPAAARLLRAGFTLGDNHTRCPARKGRPPIGPDHAKCLGDPALELRAGGRLKPVARRLEVAERALRQLFAAASSRPLAAMAAASTRGLLALAGLPERIAGFAATWPDGEEGLRQELAGMLGRDPLGDLTFAPKAGGRRAAAAPTTAGAAQVGRRAAAAPTTADAAQVGRQAAAAPTTTDAAQAAPAALLGQPPCERRAGCPFAHVHGLLPKQAAPAALLGQLPCEQRARALAGDFAEPCAGKTAVTAQEALAEPGNFAEPYPGKTAAPAQEELRVEPWTVPAAPSPCRKPVQQCRRR